MSNECDIECVSMQIHSVRHLTGWGNWVFLDIVQVLGALTYKSYVIPFPASRGPYFGFEGPSVTVVRDTLLMSGSVSGARRAKMSRMSVCRYTRPDLEQRNLE